MLASTWAIQAERQPCGRAAQKRRLSRFRRAGASEPHRVRRRGRGEDLRAPHAADPISRDARRQRRDCGRGCVQDGAHHKRRVLPRNKAARRGNGKKCARRTNFARLEPERAVLESKSYRRSSKLNSQSLHQYVISPRRRFRTPSGKKSTQCELFVHIYTSLL